MNKREKRDIFLCHASADKEKLVRPLYEELKAAGISLWYDEAEIKWGESLVEKVQNGLNISRYVMVCLTPSFASPGGKWRTEELNIALSLQVESGRVRVLPLVCGLA